MTKRIGNKHIAQHRGKDERRLIKASNIAAEAVKKEATRLKYRNSVKNQPPV